MTAGNRSLGWFFPWVPVGLVAVLGATLVGLMFIAPGTAPAAGPAPDGAAGLLTTDKLVLTVNVPPLTSDKTTLLVELVNGDDKVLDQVRKQLDKIVTVVRVDDISSENFVERDLMLIKVACSSDKRKRGSRKARSSTTSDWQIRSLIDPFQFHSSSRAGT